MLHHLNNVAPVEGKEEPKMVTRMVQLLASMIKPADPTMHIMDMIWGNANNWGYNTLTILTDHYNAGLDKALKELTGLLTPDWRVAFQVAVRWARKNLTRLSQDVVDHAEALITARVSAGESQQPQPEPPKRKMKKTPKSPDVMDQAEALITPQVSAGEPQLSQPELPRRGKKTSGTQTEAVQTVIQPSGDKPPKRRVATKPAAIEQLFSQADTSTSSIEDDDYYWSDCENYWVRMPKSGREGDQTHKKSTPVLIPNPNLYNTDC